MQNGLSFPLLLFCIAITLPAVAQEAPKNNLDGVLDGFEEDATLQDEGEYGFSDAFSSEEKISDEPVIPPDHAEEMAGMDDVLSPLRLNGALTLSSGYNYAQHAPAAGETDHRGLSRLRGTLKLELTAHLNDQWKGYLESRFSHDLVYRIQGRGNYTNEQLSDQESQAELREAWIQGSLTHALDLKLGRQIVVWGKSDNLRVTDVLNPMDWREPGLVDIEYLRLPLSMLRMDYYRGDWNLSMIGIQEIRFHKMPQPGSAFYGGQGGALPEKSPGNSGGNLEYAVALNGLFSGWDLSLYWARLFDDQPHRALKNGVAIRRHDRLTMLGGAADMAFGNWLLKTELAHFRSLGFLVVPNVKKQRTDLLLGVEYSGFDDTVLSLEIVDRRLHGHSPALAAQGIKKDSWQTALRYSGEFLHARLKVTLLTLLFGTPGEGGGVTRLQGDYEWSESVRLIGGVVAYHGGDEPPFTYIADNDRLFFDLKYSF